MLKKYIFSLFLALIIFGSTSAQNVSILPSGITPAMSGTYQRLSYDALIALPNPQVGDIAFDTTFLCLRVYIGGKWVCYQSPSNTTVNIAAFTTEGGAGNDAGNDIAVDASGNVYVTGTFNGKVAFGATSETSAGQTDIFVAKYNKAGSLLWVQTAGGVSYEYVTGIALDAVGNAFITGYFIGTTTFGATNKTSVGGYDIFVAKYSSAGSFNWVQTAGGTNTDYGNNIDVDGSGNAYVTGNFFGSASFGATSKTSAGLNDIFVAKYNNVGSLQWVQTAGGTSDDFGNDVAVDASGKVYVTGNFVGTASFGAISKTSTGGYDIFVSKYDPIGTSWQWVQTITGAESGTTNGIAVDASGNSYIIGSFSGTSTFGVTPKTSAGGYDIFVAKYSSTGFFDWVETAGGIGDDIGKGISINANGNVYITGYYSRLATFGATTKNSDGFSDIFVVKCNNTGTLKWVQTAGGTGDDIGNGISVDTNGNVFITGYFKGTANFGSTTETSDGFADVFVARLQD